MKRIAFAAICTLFSLSAWAQVAHDPNDKIYKDIDVWANRGYISMLPPVRPYPVQLIEEFLKTVAQNGDPSSSLKAREYLAALSPEARPLHVGIVGQIPGVDDDITLDGAPTVDGTFHLEDWLTASFRLAPYGVTRKPGKELDIPDVYSPYADLVIDEAKVGPFYVLTDWTSMVSLGSSDLYFQAGLSRSSFGPFFDHSIVVGSQAGRAGHFDLTYRKDWWSYSGMLLAINATNDYGDISDNSNIYPNKFLVVHSFDFKPAKTFEFGYFESIIWGNRFETMYLAPFTQYMAAQSLAGFDDNCFMGFQFRWSPLSNFQYLGQVYVDDFSFNDVVKLNFDTKYKLAAETGIRITPEKGVVSDFSADYTAVMPYMYTHVNSYREYRYDEDTPNYFNYTHQGRSLGSDLEPDSDRVAVRASFRLIPKLDLTLSAAFERHGNASEDGDDDDDSTATSSANDGSIYDDGYETYTKKDGTTSARNTFNKGGTNFLTQDLIETKARAGVGVAFTLPTPVGSFTAGVDYFYEYGWNRDLVEGDDGVTHYYVFSGTWRW